jgi:hypothetical protein
MVLLSGKRKCKDNIQKIIDNFIDPYLEHRHTELKENLLCMHTSTPLGNKIVQLMDRVPLQLSSSGNLGFQFKTNIKIKPEYELYHLLYGKTKIYNEQKLHIVQECLRKKMSFAKIKYICSLYV